MRRLALVVVLVAGCMGLGRQPDASKFFTLTPLAGDGAGPPAAGGTKLSLGLGPVVLPAYLQRTQLVRRVGPNEVRLGESDRWAEPLAEGFRRTLQQNLVQLLGPDRVVVYPWPVATALDLRVGVDVLRFEPGPGGSAALAVRWTLRDGKGADLLAARESVFTEPAADGDPAAAVEAMSRTLATLSDEIAHAIREQRPARGPAHR